MTMALVTLTPSAIGRIRDLMSGNSDKVLRLGTRSAGCSGLKYEFQFAEHSQPLDVEISIDGVTIYVDSLSLLFVAGTEIDWVEKDLSRSFEFKNPNETARCGCGESFSVKPCV